MAKTIHKYRLKLGGVLSIPLPEDAKVLSLGNQYNKPVIWVELDASEPTVNRYFRVIATGMKVPENVAYIGTALLDGGSFILHLYEEL